MKKHSVNPVSWGEKMKARSHQYHYASCSHHNISFNQCPEIDPTEILNIFVNAEKSYIISHEEVKKESKKVMSH